MSTKCVFDVQAEVYLSFKLVFTTLVAIFEAGFLFFFLIGDVHMRSYRRLPEIYLYVTTHDGVKYFDQYAMTHELTYSYVTNEYTLCNIVIKQQF